MMNENKQCPKCGALVPANAPEGLCPRCLGALNLEPETVLTGAEAASTSAPPPTAELGPLFPQLELLGLIGRGGMGVVYKARQKELERIVALKILPPGIGSDPAFAERFAREAKALARLNHPGIVTVYDFGRANGLFYFLMEYVDGVSLRQLMNAGRISPREALAIVPQICDALQYAHDQGIVHRDIKPENILLDRQGRVKVADFGLAKLVAATQQPLTPSLFPSDGERVGDRPGEERAPALTEAGKVMGTPQYMAPEQAEHPGEVDHRADIYALGVVFYQMLTGELPGQRIEPPSRKVHIDVRLDEVVLRTLERQPERRYQQVSEVRTAVETIIQTAARATPDGGVGKEPPPLAPRIARSRRVRMALAVLAGCFVVGLAAFLGRLFSGRAEPPAELLTQQTLQQLVESNQITQATISYDTPGSLLNGSLAARSNPQQLSLSKPAPVFAVSAQKGDINVTEFAKRYFTVLGQVQRPGTYDMPTDKSVSLLQAIATAGGYTRIGNPRRITVQRTVDKANTLMKLDAEAMAVDKKQRPFVIRPDDVIVVGEKMGDINVTEFAKRRFTVLGQVQRPGTYDMPTDESVSLLQAIATAGGYTPIGNPHRITVLRTVDKANPLMKLDAEAMAADKKQRPFVIQPDDVIVVGETQKGDINVTEFAKRRFTVLGQVQRPGTYDMPTDESVSLLQAIATAGGYTPIGNPRRITVQRTVDKANTLMKLNAEAMAADKKQKPFVIQPDDVIIVGEKWI